MQTTSKKTETKSSVNSNRNSNVITEQELRAKIEKEQAEKQNALIESVLQGKGSRAEKVAVLEALGASKEQLNRARQRKLQGTNAAIRTAIEARHFPVFSDDAKTRKAEFYRFLIEHGASEKQALKDSAFSKQWSETIGNAELAYRLGKEDAAKPKS